ncbi:MAG TPA: TonB-dependent receptor [Rhodanobacteraceae bacterium]|nr:TonB-dependent receptor [Rhodanobacteraceae bacterium]
MRLDRSELSKAVQTALSLGAVAAVGVAGTAFAQTTAPQGQTNNQQQPQTLQTIVVTGSHIRRVDLETSNPVVAVSAQQIQATGKMTLGDVVQQLPVITGGIENPRVNNGGGSGQTLVGLRDLGASRTLVLVDGQRVINNDLNSIPAAAVERIEVLTDGASAIYGSDAIGGVINIILKENYQGAQFQLNYGISDHDDGERKGASFVFGQTSDKGSILAGVDYNKFDQVLQAQRKYSKNALSLTATNTNGSSVALPGSGVIALVGGSSYAARDRIAYPGSACNLSLNPSVAAAGTSPTTTGDYHCFSGALGDKYNYAAVNLLMTPQERTNAFFKGVYHLTDSIDFTASVYHNKTSAGFQLAPAVFGTPTGASISAESYYNPFGVDFTPSNGNVYRSRLFPAGNRAARVNSITDQLLLGLRGNVNLFNQSWTWNVGYNYGHFSSVVTTLGLPNQAALLPGLGPSFLNSSGVVQCGTAANPISLTTCTPWDPFNLYSSSATAALSSAASPALTNSWDIERTIHADISGGLFDLPAGTVQLAAGVDYRKEYTDNTVSSDLLINPATGTCTLGSQCSAHLQGGYNVKEVYAEAFIPILKDLPFVHALNLTVGDRYSKYSDFGSTSNWKIALEYRPIEDLLLRGTINKVFRAPTIGNVFGPPVSSAPLLTSDPCNFSGSGANPNAGNPACVGVPATGSFSNNQVSAHQQINALTSGSAFYGFPLGPEKGKSFDFGAVYSPHYVPGLTVSADIWRVYLNDTITAVGAQTELNLCFAGVTQYCPLISRFIGGASPGQIRQIVQVTGNLGRIDVRGIDVSGQYKLPQFSFGQFNVGLNATYLKSYTIQTAPGQPGNQVLNAVGLMGSTGSPLQASCPFAAGAICFFPRIRAQGTLGWQLGPWDAQWTMTYSSKFKVGSYDISQGDTAVAAFTPTGPAGPYVLKYGASVYNNVTVGYNIEPINTRIDVGVDNVFDKQPPLLYANNSQNANTDPNDFDTLGRYYWARLTVKF